MFNFTVKESLMKKYLQIIVLSLFSLASAAQQNYFVYLQADNKQPFYVTINGKILSSSSAGYLIIPKLTTGSYEMTVGFPKNEWPVQKLPFKIENADAGYLLKNFGDKGWGLYNMQTMDVSMNGGSSASTKPATKSDDDFSSVLSAVTNTPVPESTTIVAVPDNKQTAAAPVVIQAPTTISTEVEKTKSPAIVRIANTQDAGGRTMIYVDNSSWSGDTIRVFIPAVSSSVAQSSDNNSQNTSMTATTTTANIPVGTANDSRFLDIDLSKPAPATAVQSGAKPVTDAGSVRTVNFNSDCKANASDEDFIKTRKKMVSENTDDAMIAAAMKAFKKNCYSTEQIKNLGLLFLSDAGRYRFFDAAYPRIYDTQHFASLEAQLSEAYYITRFKAMIRN